jgi:hypothetical protein
MTDDALSRRGHALEDEYFWKKDQQLTEKMRKAGAAERTRRDVGAKVGITIRVLQERRRSASRGNGDPSSARPVVRWRGPTGASRRGRARSWSLRARVASWRQPRRSAVVGLAGTTTGRQVFDGAVR